MMKPALAIVCFLILSMLLCPLVFSEEDKNIVAEPYLSEGDMHLFDGELKDAQKIYDFVLKSNPNSYEALWRLTRFYILRGMAGKKINDKKKDWEAAEGYGRQAIEMNPDGAEGHLYLAIAVGKQALYSSPSKKVKAVWEVKREAERAIELDPTKQRAYLALGAWHRNVSTASSLEKQLAKIFFGELPQGSLEESLQLLLKSIELGGNNVRNYYELALTYEAMKNYEAAKKEYETALDTRPYNPEDLEVKERIKKTLKKSKYN